MKLSQKQSCTLNLLHLLGPDAIKITLCELQKQSKILENSDTPAALIS